VRITIDEPFRWLFPEALIGVIVASEINSLRSREEAARELETAVEEAKATVGDDDLASHPAVAPWREAYRRFGVKPSAHRSSIEGLLRSIRSRGVPSVNPLVDFYNAVSLRHLLPCGGEDLDAIQGDLRLTVATGGESFVPLGGTESMPPQPGEVVYADDAGIVCRAWNWREADRTKLTNDTRRAVLVIEALPPRIAAELQQACYDLAELVETYLGATCRVVVLGNDGPSEASLDA
jgi:DNA/RNA-binding domain of Phe-tRNA-synthetase-like protein